MFTRVQASRIKEDFWTTFGRYMSPVVSVSGMKVNWINYHTRLKDVYFRMDAGPKAAFIGITVEHRDAGIQELYFEQFMELRTMLHTALAETWQWQLHTVAADGRTISRIGTEITGVSVFNQQDWPALISFFKPRMIALDSFWEDAQYAFDALR